MSTDFLEYNLNDWNLLLSKVFSHHRQTLQWEILLHEISGEDEDEYRYEAGETFTDEKGKPVVGRTDIFSIYAIYFLTDDKVTYIDSNVHYNDFMHPNMVALANLTDARQRLGEV